MELDYINTYWKILISVYVFILGFPLVYIQSKVPLKFKRIYNNYLGKKDIDDLKLIGLVLVIYFASLGNHIVIACLEKVPYLYLTEVIYFLNFLFLIAFCVCSVYFLTLKWNDYDLSDETNLAIGIILYDKLEKEYIDHIKNIKTNPHIREEFYEFILLIEENYTIKHIYQSLFNLIINIKTGNSDLTFSCGDIYELITAITKQLTASTKITDATKDYIIQNVSRILNSENKRFISDPASRIFNFLGEDAVKRNKEEEFKNILDWNIYIDLKHNLCKYALKEKKFLLVSPYIQSGNKLFDNVYKLSLCSIFSEGNTRYMDKALKIANDLGAENDKLFKKTIDLNADDLITLNSVHVFKEKFKQYKNLKGDRGEE